MLFYQLRFFSVLYVRRVKPNFGSCVEICSPICVTTKRRPLANYKNRVKYESLSPRLLFDIRYYSKRDWVELNGIKRDLIEKSGY